MEINLKYPFFIYMNEKLLLQIDYSADDYIRASVFMRNQTLLHRYNFLFTFTIIFFAIATFTFLLANDKTSINYAGLVAIAFFPALFLGVTVVLLDKYVFPFFGKQTIKRQMKSSLSFNNENEICFSDEGIEISNELSSSKLKWEAFLKAFESDSDFIFYTSNKTSIFIPKTAFLSDADTNFLRCLSRAKLSDKAQF